MDKEPWNIDAQDARPLNPLSIFGSFQESTSHVRAPHDRKLLMVAFEVLWRLRTSQDLLFGIHVEHVEPLPSACPAAFPSFVGDACCEV